MITSLKYFLILCLLALCSAGQSYAASFYISPKDCDSTIIVVSVFSGKGTITIPGCFSLVSKEVIAHKSMDGGKPELMYGVKELGYVVSTSFTTIDVPTESIDLEQMKTIFEMTFSKMGCADISSNIKTVNGKAFLAFEYKQ